MEQYRLLLINVGILVLALLSTTIDFPVSDLGTDNRGTEWYKLDYNDSKWGKGNVPLGYGDESKAKYGALLYNNQGSYYFRRKFEIRGSDYKRFYSRATILRIAGDNVAKVYLNGTLIDTDPDYGKVGGHEFAYWKRRIR